MLIWSIFKFLMRLCLWFYTLQYLGSTRVLRAQTHFPGKIYCEIVLHQNQAIGIIVILIHIYSICLYEHSTYVGTAESIPVWNGDNRTCVIQNGRLYTVVGQQNDSKKKKHFVPKDTCGDACKRFCCTVIFNALQMYLHLTLTLDSHKPRIYVTNFISS